MRQHFIHYIRNTNNKYNITGANNLLGDFFLDAIRVCARECSVYFLFEFKANATAIMKDKPTKGNKTDTV